jgi:hypothetical protein
MDGDTHEQFPRRVDIGQPHRGGRHSSGADDRGRCKESGEPRGGSGSKPKSFSGGPSASRCTPALGFVDSKTRGIQDGYRRAGIAAVMLDGSCPRKRLGQAVVQTCDSE